MCKLWAHGLPHFVQLPYVDSLDTQSQDVQYMAIQCSGGVGCNCNGSMVGLALGLALGCGCLHGLDGLDGLHGLHCLHGLGALHGLDALHGLLGVGAALGHLALGCHSWRWQVAELGIGMAQWQ